MQRVPETEKRGRRHSSTVTVVCLDAEDTRPGFRVREQDVRTDTYRASGAGGQHRNKTDSAIRLTHLPTGLVVTATEQRSQHQNREVAWQRLRSALADQASQAAHDATNQTRQAVFGEARSWTWCGWRDEVRTPTGEKASMRRTLAGRLDPVL